MRTYAVSTCLHASDELNNYLTDYLPFYNRVQRRVYQQIKNGALLNENPNKFVGSVRVENGVLKRTANSIVHNMIGRINALVALKETELIQAEEKLTAVNKRISDEQAVVDGLKEGATKNTLTEEQLVKYRAAKSSLYFLRNRRNMLTIKKNNLEKNLYKETDGKRVKNPDHSWISLCFGSKELFSKQYRLEENGFRSHEGWKNAFVRRRDSGIFYLGSKDESFGNQNLQLRFNGTDFTMFLFRDIPFRNGPKVIVQEHVRFPYMQSELKAAIEGDQPVTYRITRKKNHWYLTAMFSKDSPLMTTRAGGVFGVDYNSGFLEVAETNSSGNMVDAQHIELEYHGTGTKAESEIKEKISHLVQLALEKGKDIVIEKLNFTKKKAGTIKGRRGQGKGYNKMIHAFDYSRYTFWMQNLCLKYGVGFNQVNPAYTSRIGNQKYAEPRKMTVHRGAALVIARKGQGFKDKLKARSKTKSGAKARSEPKVNPDAKPRTRSKTKTEAKSNPKPTQKAETKTKTGAAARTKVATRIRRKH